MGEQVELVLKAPLWLFVAFGVLLAVEVVVDVLGAIGLWRARRRRKREANQ